MKKVYISFIIFIVLISCNEITGERIRGNGKQVTKTYDFANFSSIDVENTFHVLLKQDSAFGVQIKTDENLMQYINVQVNEGELEIDEKDGYDLKPTDELKVYISMPVIKKLDISGASSAKTEDKFIQKEPFFFDISGASNASIQIKSPKVEGEVSGASTVNMHGETKDAKIEVSGASSYKGFDLLSENTNVDASGASTASVFASVQLAADASGASSVRYKGNPNVKSSTSGAGSIKNAED